MQPEMRPDARPSSIDGFAGACTCTCACRANLPRPAGAAPAPPSMRLLLLDSGVRIDLGAATVYRPDNTAAVLSRNALACLEALIAARGNCVAAETLRAVHRIGDPAHTVRALRRALADARFGAGGPCYIITAGWHGYRLDPARCAYRVVAIDEAAGGRAASCAGPAAGPAAG